MKLHKFNITALEIRQFFKIQINVGIHILKQDHKEVSGIKLINAYIHIYFRNFLESSVAASPTRERHTVSLPYHPCNISPLTMAARLFHLSLYHEPISNSLPSDTDRSWLFNRGSAYKMCLLVHVWSHTEAGWPDPGGSALWSEHTVQPSAVRVGRE